MELTSFIIYIVYIIFLDGGAKGMLGVWWKVLTDSGPRQEGAQLWSECQSSSTDGNVCMWMWSGGS